MPLILPVELIKNFYKCKHIFLKQIDYLKKKYFAFLKEAFLLAT